MRDGRVDVSRADANVVETMPVAATYAERVIWATYGDEVSVWDKGKTLLKFGKRDDLGSTNYSTLAVMGGNENETFVTTDAITHFASSSGSDTGDCYIEGHTVSGTGANAQFTFVTQTVTLAGQTKTALTTPLARVSRVANKTATAWVGNIYVAEDVTFTGGVPQTATAIHIQVPAGEQQSFKCATTISNVDYYILTSGLVSVDKKTTAIVDFRLEIREVGGVFRPVAMVSCKEGDSQYIPLDPPVIVPKNADIRITALASTTSVEADAWFNGYLAKVI
jgi:hypothetical protein